MNNVKHNIVFDSKFDKTVGKFLKKTKRQSDQDKLDKIIDQLKIEGYISDIGGTHMIRQPIYSEHTKTKITGWSVVPISRRHDLRLAYRNHGNNRIEVKLGRAVDIGYKH